MRGGVLPPALLFVALGLALGFTPRRAWLPSVCALLVTLAAFTLVPAPPGLADTVFAGCWVSVIATAAMCILSADSLRGPQSHFLSTLASGRVPWFLCPDRD